VAGLSCSQHDQQKVDPVLLLKELLLPLLLLPLLLL
jgi:hypothetical protein